MSLFGYLAVGPSDHGEGGEFVFRTESKAYPL
jgi:hypothetical protein